MRAENGTAEQPGSDTNCILTVMLHFPPQSIIISLQFYLIGYELQILAFITGFVQWEYVEYSLFLKAFNKSKV